MTSNIHSGEMPNARQRMLVSEAIRGLGVILNMASIYNPEHPVFRRTVLDRFPALNDAVTPELPLTFFFDKSDIVVAGQVVEPGNDMFARIATMFRRKGVGGLTFLAGLTVEELVDFVVLVHQDLGTTSESLGRIMRRKGLSHIREEKILKSGGGSGDGGGDSAVRRSGSGGGTFDLDQISDASLADLMQQHGEHDSVDLGSTQVKSFVLGELGQLKSGQKNMHEVADAIAANFERRLNERVEEVRHETEVRIQRLESIKDMVLQELEMRHVAAVILNARLQIIAINDSGRALLGNIDSLEPGSELAKFVCSNEEKKLVQVRGRTCMADMIISDHPEAQGGAVLICLEPGR